MRSKFGLLLFFAVILTPSLVAPSEPAQIQHQASAELIALHEAEILIYLLPDSQEVREQGFEIGWELQTSPELNQDDFYVFWVVNATRPNVEGSRTLGYYAVNKHTADVWDEGLARFAAGQELEGVQRILRRAHHVDEATIRKFRSRQTFRPKPAH